MASIVDVAKKANVGVGTVSRVLNNHPNVAPATTEAVQQAMETLGYTRRTLRPGPKTPDRRGIRTGTVMFLSISPSPPERLYQIPALPFLLDGMHATLKSYGLDLILAHSPDAEYVPPVLARNQVDGVILFGNNKPTENLQDVLLKVPAVWSLRSSVDRQRDFDHVTYDNSHVGEIAARYLIDHGHNNLAFLNLQSGNPAFQERRDSFANTGRQHGAKVDILETSLIKGDSKVSPARAAKLVTDLRKIKPFPKAVFIPADNFMLAFYQALRNHGIEPETDIKLIGCNNDPQFMEQMHPRPATIDIGLREVGKKGVTQLLRRMADPEADSKEIFIQPKLNPAGTEEQSSAGNHPPSGKQERHLTTSEVAQ